MPHFIPLYGLVLAGGKSARMGQEKALMIYHQQPQVVNCQSLLNPFCQAIYLSRRTEQDFMTNLPILQDYYQEIGPMGGLLTAMETYPNVAWLLLACDMPAITTGILTTLVQGRAPSKMATAIQNPKTSKPEPLCTLYEPAFLPVLQQARKAQDYSLQRLLINADIKLIQKVSEASLINVNTPDEYLDYLADRENSNVR